MNTNDIAQLSQNSIQKIHQMGYRIGEGYKTHSSTFYPLTKGDKDFLLKIDQTPSGSLLHQVKYSKFQDSLGLPHIPIAHIDDESSFLIMEKLHGVKKTKNCVNENIMEEWGKQMRLIHDNSFQKIFTIWVQKNAEFTDVSFQSIITGFLSNSRNNINQLDYEESIKVRKIIEHIENNIDKYYDEAVLTHGDPHLNNTMIYNNKVLVFDPNGTVLYGSRYIDLAIIAIDFPGYFLSTIDNSGEDKNLFASFLGGYGDIDFELLKEFILLRGVERYAFSSFIKNINNLTDYVFGSKTQFP